MVLKFILGEVNIENGPEELVSIHSWIKYK